MPRYNLFAFTNPVPGQEQEFNDWNTYLNKEEDAKPLTALCFLECWAWALLLCEGPHPWSYMAVYEIEIDDLNRTLTALRAASGTDAMPLSPALQDKRMVWIYEPITERVERGAQ